MKHGSGKEEVTVRSRRPEGALLRWKQTLPLCSKENLKVLFSNCKRPGRELELYPKPNSNLCGHAEVWIVQ